MERERRDVGGLGAVGLIVLSVMAAGLVAGRGGAIVGGLVALVGVLVRTGARIEDASGSAEPHPASEPSTSPAPIRSTVVTPGMHAALASEAPVLGEGTDDERIAVTGSAASLRPTLPIRPVALPRVDWRAHRIDSPLLTRLTTCVVTLVFAWFFLHDLGDNPAGFFCDEAEIGIRAREYLSKQLLAGQNPFFYQHFGYSHLGTLPLLTTAPFVMIYGLSDFSVRLASMAWAAAAIPVLILFVRKVGWSYGEAGVIAFAASPVFIHFARINFGQSPSILAVSVGLLCYAVGKDRGQRRWPLLAGAAVAISAYGNSAFYLAAPVILMALAIGELAVQRLAVRGYRDIALAALAAGVAWLPVLIRWQTDPEFMKRMREKTQTNDSLVSIEQLRLIADNYGKYFGMDYLFAKGESGVPGANVSRHSVIGAGELQYLLLPMVVCGVIGVLRLPAVKTRLFGVFGVALMLLYPIPDAMATPRVNAPYTVTTIATMFFVPVLAALGVHWLVVWLRRREISAILRPRVVSGALIGLTLLVGVRFFDGPYADYPNVSADYYGWQFGPRQAVAEFKTYRNDYERFQLDGDFNEAFVFLDFYLYGDQELRNRSMIGGLVLVDLRKVELIAVRAEKYDALMQSNDRMRSYISVKDVIYYPNGSVAMYVLDVRLGNDDGRANRPY